MGVHHIKDMDGYKKFLDEHDLVVLDAFATWCGPCKQIAPLVHKMAEEEFKEKVHFAKFDVDHIPELAQKLGVRAMPTFILFKKGEKVDEYIGASPPGLRLKLTAFAV